MDGERSSAPARLAELVGALSLGVDLGFGQPMEHVLRQCLIALRLADRAGLPQESRGVVYYTALLVNVGCHSDAHEQAKWFGDDIALKATKYDDFSGVRAAVSGISMIGAGRPPLHRIRMGLAFLVTGRREVEGMIARHASLARTFAEQLGLPKSVCAAVAAAYEQWDGRGWPGTLRGEEVPVEARIAQLAEFVEVAHRVGGIEAAVELCRKRGGKKFDPRLSALVCSHASEIFSGLDSVGTWQAVIEEEPALAGVLSEEQFDSTLQAIADFIDLKSPYTLGHSRAVAELAATAALELGRSEADARTIRRAGLVLGFGRLGISNSIWDKRGPLATGEWERVRMHPYFTERMLRQSPALSPLGALAVQHRERLDGSGYPRGAAGAAISLPARILAAADAYQAMREVRPHREALSAERAAETLRSEVRLGRLDRDSVEAVLTAAGHRGRRRREGPAGLTLREVEVLRLLAQGMSTKEIAARLVMSPKTASNHVEHIYTKINANNRVTASLFAVQHGLLPENVT